MYIIFKDKKSKRSHKAVGIKVFLTFFCLLMEESIPLTDGAQKHIDLVDPDSDPDPQHWSGHVYTQGT